MLTTNDHIHFIGIGGAGLSAIARVLLERGVPVSGSDRQTSPLAEALREAGVRVVIGHAADNLGDATLVVRSSAVPDDNVEVLAARARSIPVLKRAEFLERLTAGKREIAVAGTHGKSTTTAMIAWMLSEMQLDPSFIVGGVVENLGTNARAGDGPHFVIEADEYDRMFLGLQPDIAVVTNVEHDHPDLFPTERDFAAAFEAFIDRLKPSGSLVFWGGDPAARRLGARALDQGLSVLRYGLEPDSELRADGLVAVAGAGFGFDVVYRGEAQGRVQLLAPGEHNVLNALAVFGVGLLLGLPFDGMAASLAAFRGVGRRFDVRGEAGGVVVVDDYAHHPTEIRATIAAARARYPGRALWVAWQPHTYSRVRLLCDAFSAAFGAADHVVVTGVYAARESVPPGFSLDGLVGRMAHRDARRIDGLDEAARFLSAELEPGSVLLVLSAGDAEQVSEQVLDSLRASEK